MKFQGFWMTYLVVNLIKIIFLFVFIVLIRIGWICVASFILFLFPSLFSPFFLELYVIFSHFYHFMICNHFQRFKKM